LWITNPIEEQEKFQLGKLQLRRQRILETKSENEIKALSLKLHSDKLAIKYPFEKQIHIFFINSYSLLKP